MPQIIKQLDEKTKATKKRTSSYGLPQRSRYFRIRQVRRKMMQRGAMKLDLIGSEQGRPRSCPNASLSSSHHVSLQGQQGRGVPIARAINNTSCITCTHIAKCAEFNRRLYEDSSFHARFPAARGRCLHGRLRTAPLLIIRYLFQMRHHSASVSPDGTMRIDRVQATTFKLARTPTRFRIRIELLHFDERHRRDKLSIV